jgi:hypothetical protein
VDPVLGGDKVARQAEALAWPGVARVGQTTPQELSALLRWCLTDLLDARLSSSVRRLRE